MRSTIDDDGAVRAAVATMLCRLGIELRVAQERKSPRAVACAHPGIEIVLECAELEGSLAEHGAVAPAAEPAEAAKTTG